jgi:hypothetical protein
MSNDYLERIAARLPEDVLARYCDVEDEISRCHEELWKLRDELIGIARAHGVPDIDDPASVSKERIRQVLGADRMEINSIWASTSPEWSCPCCRRSKPDCARLGAKAQVLGKLVAHHDHIEDFIDVVLSNISKELVIEASSSVDAQCFIRRGWELFARFDRIVICEDCNNAEAKGKNLVGADQAFYIYSPRDFFFYPSTSKPSA